MTKVQIWKHGRRYGVTAQGHAPTSEGCAAVSVLMTTIAGYVLNARCDVEVLRLDSGDAAVAWHGGRDARAAFDMAVIGFEQFEQSYPDMVQVKVDEG